MKRWIPYLVLVAVVAFSHPLQGVEPKPSTDVVATPAPPRLHLVSQREPKQMLTGARDYLTLEAQGKIPLEYPQPDDFRLQCLSDNSAWVPMLFGADGKSGSGEFIQVVRPVRKIRLELGSYHVLLGDQVLTHAQKGWTEWFHEVNALANLKPGARYRLSWTPRVKADGEQLPTMCEFQIPEAPADLPRKAPATEGEDPLTGPLYVCEILYRHHGTLFLARDFLPKSTRLSYDWPTIGFADGKYVRPPERPRFSRQQLLIAQVAGPELKRLLPLAEPTHWLGARLEFQDARPARFVVSATCTATIAKLPTRQGEPAFAMFEGGVFRFELLDRNVERMRQDHAFWRKRTDKIRAELLARRDWVNRDEEGLSVAATVLEDPVLVSDVRVALRRWIVEKIPLWNTKNAASGFPRELIEALAAAGSAEDVDLLRQFIDALAATESAEDVHSLRKAGDKAVDTTRLINPAIQLARHVGARQTRPLLFKLLDDNAPYPYGDYWHHYRRFDPRAPEPTVGDLFAAAVTQAFVLKPEEYELQSLTRSLLTAHDEKRIALSAEELGKIARQVRDQSQGLHFQGPQFYPTLQARQAGRVKLKKWIEENMQQAIDRQQAQMHN